MLSAFFADASVNRTSNADGEAYASWIAPRYSRVGTAETKGRLRISRVSGVVTTYYWNEGRWAQIDRAASDGRAVIGIQATASDWSFANADVKVGFDNFVVDAPEADCP